jgi:hypothetical protein
MPTTYTISEHDYVQCAQINSIPRKTTRRVHLIIEVLLVIAGVTWLALGNIALGCGLIGAAIGANLFPWILKTTLAPYLLKRHYKKYKKMQEPIRVEFMDEGLGYNSEAGNSTLKWSAIEAWREHGQYLLIYLAPNVYYSLPLRIGAEGFPLDRLQQALQTHIGAPV